MTTIKAQGDDGSAGSSKNEIRFRNFVALTAYKFFPETYDVLVCCKNIGILGALDIDIPIMVYNNELNCLHRFVVEYKGEPWNPNDPEKIQRVKDRGWVFIQIMDKSEYSRNKSGRMLDERARQFCKKLYEEVQSRETGGNIKRVQLSGISG